ncbi:methyltransferase domain-containing protein [Catellatospora sp. KI3]|uniref:methyltransferase domain-containing protein n=1 Tax=Catellatospora sp. KI3 TaxID=3041620 RepID=UPI0024824C78|nr:methyltransferase domain-containing protein [Catellatospora sp. KI3]MDI1463608.1 methyltransferase domain-containing protein [Catellatospora sp. KI3]
MTEEPLIPHYAGVDRSPAEVRARLAAYLESAAAHPVITRIREVAADAMRLAPGQRVLDGGCGLGEAAYPLALRVGPEGSVDGVDKSQNMLALADRRYAVWLRSHPGAAAVRFTVGDLTGLDFPAGSFDAVRCERTLQHLDDAQAVIAELVRVTRPGGRVCLVDTDWESLAFEGIAHEVLTPMLWRLRQRTVMSNPSMGRTLRNRLRQAGVVEVECHPVTVHFTDPQEAQHVVPYFEREVLLQIVGQGEGNDEMVCRWLAAVADAARRDEFLVALTIWVVAGTAPVRGTGAR